MFSLIPDAFKKLSTFIRNELKHYNLEMKIQGNSEK